MRWPTCTAASHCGELDFLDSAISDFDEALRLDPALVMAFQARG